MIQSRFDGCDLSPPTRRAPRSTATMRRCRRRRNLETTRLTRLDWRGIVSAAQIDRERQTTKRRTSALPAVFPLGRNAPERFHREWNLRNTPSLRGVQRRSNPPPDEPGYVRQAGDCFGAARLAMTVSTHDENALAGGNRFMGAVWLVRQRRRPGRQACARRQTLSNRILFSRFGPVQGHSSTDERLESIRIDLIALMQVDRAPDVAVEAGVEQT